MNILIIGGTIFVGKHLVEAARARGHNVTLFNRGQHNPDMFPDVERLRGNRDGELDALKGRTWDAVIDTCGYVPRVVRQSAELLSGAAGHYTFISSISVFSDFSQIGTTEDGPLGKLEDETVEEITGEIYGPLKVLCEKVVQEAFPGRSLIVRPGLIVGPDDVSDRFTYWPHRVDQGGEVLAPGKPAETTQIIDGRDLAEFTIKMIEKRGTGPYNVTGPADPLSFGALLDTCREVSGSDSRFTWVDEAFLVEQKVQPWSQLPLWIPVESDPAYAGFSSFDCGKAIAAGLSFRSIADTVRDTLEYDRGRSGEGLFKNCLTREREAELLALWHAREAASS